MRSDPPVMCRKRPCSRREDVLSVGRLCDTSDSLNGCCCTFVTGVAVTAATRTKRLSENHIMKIQIRPNRSLSPTKREPSSSGHQSWELLLCVCVCTFVPVTSRRIQKKNPRSDRRHLMQGTCTPTWMSHPPNRQVGSVLEGLAPAHYSILCRQDRTEGRNRNRKTQRMSSII
jgi:hypothetical protein